MNNQDPQTAIDYNLYPSSARPSGLHVPQPEEVAADPTDAVGRESDEMTLSFFDSLSAQDMKNGAIISEIRSALKVRDRLKAELSTFHTAMQRERKPDWEKWHMDLADIVDSISSTDEVASIKTPVSQLDVPGTLKTAARELRYMATSFTLKANFVPTDLEIKALKEQVAQLQQHLTAAEQAAGHSPTSSAPLSETVLELKSQVESAKEALQGRLGDEPDCVVQACKEYVAAEDELPDAFDTEDYCLSHAVRSLVQQVESLSLTVSDLKSYRDRLSDIDLIFGCDHVSKGPDDAVEVVRHVRELKQQVANYKSPEEAAAIEETHRMQLAAIMTASIQNTESTRSDRINQDNPYWTQAYEDVCVAINREMKLRDQLATHTQAMKVAKEVLESVAELAPDFLDDKAGHFSKITNDALATINNLLEK